ncbi:MAG: hypothetical protein H0X05_04500, partial [Actinobacteria bacterium]|nr:hypothetical protein [Actinomycetota bacterium]
SEIDAAVGEAESAAEALQAANDHVGLAEAAVALEYLEFMRGRIARSHAWAIRGLRHAIAAGRQREAAQSSADVVHTAVIGPLPFEEFAATADSMLLSPDEPISAATGQAFMVLSALAAGDDDALEEREALWRAIVDGHGLPWLGATHAHLFASVETWVGRPDAAERRLREAREVLATMGDLWWVGTLDSSLCRAVAAQGHDREFLRLADALEAAALVPDRQMQVRRNVVRARAMLLRGSAAHAEASARRGLELAEPTDLVLDHADALLTLSDVLRERGFGDEADAAAGQARAMLRSKGCHRPSSVDG